MIGLTATRVNTINGLCQSVINRLITAFQHHDAQTVQFRINPSQQIGYPAPEGPADEPPHA